MHDCIFYVDAKGRKYILVSGSMFQVPGLVKINNMEPET